MLLSCACVHDPLRPASVLCKELQIEDLHVCSSGNGFDS